VEVDAENFKQHAQPQQDEKKPQKDVKPVHFHVLPPVARQN
jgi:hypothetical protein